MRLDLPEAEFKDLGSSFAAVSAQLSESRAKALNQSTDFESIVENLEDAVALFSPEERPMFCNPAMNTVRPVQGRTRSWGKWSNGRWPRKPEAPTTLQSGAGE